MKQQTITAVASLILTLSCLNAAAQSVTNAYTLTYESLGLNNGDFIQGAYPGIPAATVTHRALTNNVVFSGVFFWSGVSPGDGYGNLTNVAAGPTNAGAFAGVVITPNYTSNYVRLLSFDMATRDDGFGDLQSFPIYVQDDPYSTLLLIPSPIVTITGDATNTTHTHFDFSASPARGPVNKGLAIFWEARNGRAAIDNVEFEIVGPLPSSTELPPVILSLTRAGATNFVLTWSAISNRTYRLLYTDDLQNSNWLSQSPDVTALGATATATNLADITGQRFYRVLLLP